MARDNFNIPLMKTLLIALLFGTQGHAAGLLDPIPPVRPTHQDVSLKMWNLGGSAPLKWFRGHTSTQSERDAVEEASYMGVYESIRFAKQFPGCNSTVSSSLANMNKISSKLGPGYEYAALKANDIWEVTIQGRHYTFEKYALKALQGCLSTSTVAPLCGAKISANLADLLDLRVQDGKCVKGALFEVPAPTEAFDTARSRVDAVSRRVSFVAWTPAQVQALHDTHAAHQAVSDFRCEVGLPPTPGAVDAAHRRLEGLARNIIEQHFFMMKAFSGVVDPAMTKAEECQWARKQDAAHERWMNAVLAQDWFQSRTAENDHQLAHVCMNNKDARVLILPYCKNPFDPNWNIFNCPVISCEQWLAQGI